MSKDWFLPDEVDTLDAVIRAYYEVHAAGGSLHVVLDDGNWRRSDIEHCAKWAQESGDLIGEAIAKTLLKIPDDILELARRAVEDDDGSPLAVVLHAWEARRVLEDRRARGVTHLVSIWRTIASNRMPFPSEPSFPNDPILVREYASEADAREDFECRKKAAQGESHDRAYKIEIALLGETAPIASHIKPFGI